jgi:hypothetical protein
LAAALGLVVVVVVGSTVSFLQEKAPTTTINNKNLVNLVFIDC